MSGPAHSPKSSSTSAACGSDIELSAARGDSLEKARRLRDSLDPRDGARAAYEERYEVSFSGLDDPENPKSKTAVAKWFIVLAISSCSLCVTTNSTIYTFTYDQITPLFGVSVEVATLGLSLFVVGLALGPLFLAPLSEFYGRRLIYISAYAWILLFIIPCAVARNIETIIITRFFDGLGASVFLSVAGGTIGDLFVKEELALPMLFFSCSPFLGPCLGPIIGGFINYFIDWRWTFWVILIWTGAQLLLIIIFIPETYAPVLLRRRARRLRAATSEQRWHAPIEKMDRSVTRTVLQSCTRPFELLFYEPMVSLLCILSAILLGVLYLTFGAFPLVFEKNHNFNLWQVGLTFVGLLIGMVLAVLSHPIWAAYGRRLLRQREDETGEIGGTEPEFRLPPTVVGTQLVWIGLFGFAFTTYSFVHWIVPCLFSILIGAGIVLCYAGIFTFFVESYPTHAASSLAANSFARSIFAAVFPLFGRQMYENVGYQWATAILAFLVLAMAPFPIIFFMYGKRIRGHSRFAKSG